MHAFQWSLNWNDLDHLFERACINVVCLVGERRHSFNSKVCYKESLVTQVHTQVTGGGEEQKGCNLSQTRKHKTGSQFHQKQAGGGERIAESDLKRKASSLTNWEQDNKDHSLRKAHQEGPSTSGWGSLRELSERFCIPSILLLIPL